MQSLQTSKACANDCHVDLVGSAFSHGGREWTMEEGEGRRVRREKKVITKKGKERKWTIGNNIKSSVRTESLSVTGTEEL